MNALEVTSARVVATEPPTDDQLTFPDLFDVELVLNRRPTAAEERILQNGGVKGLRIECDLPSEEDDAADWTLTVRRTTAQIIADQASAIANWLVGVSESGDHNMHQLRRNRQAAQDELNEIPWGLISRRAEAD